VSKTAVDVLDQLRLNQMLDELIAKLVSPDFLVNLGHQSTEKSHRLLHYIVHDGNYTEAKIDFASKYVQKKVYETLIRRQKGNVLQFLAASAEVPALAILRGRMFESHCHELLSPSNSLKARKLVKRTATQPKDYVESFIARPNMYFKNNMELGDTSNSDKYMVPC